MYWVDVKYEYDVIVSRGEPSPGATKQKLNELGWEEWELVAVVTLLDGRREMIFKRESKATEPPPKRKRRPPLDDD